MKTFIQSVRNNAQLIKYGLLTGASMVLVLLFTMSGPFAEHAWPKFLIPMTTAAGILLYLKYEFDQKETGLKYFRALKIGFIMSSVSFTLFSIVLYFVLLTKDPYWLGGLHTGPLFMSIFAGLTGFMMNFVMVLVLLPMLKRKHFRFRNESEQQMSEAN